MSKGRICIGNYMDNVSMMLGYKHVIFYYFPVLIIAIVCPVIPSKRGISDFGQSFMPNMKQILLQVSVYQDKVSIPVQMEHWGPARSPQNKNKVLKFSFEE